MIRTLALAGYRSLRDLRLALGPLTVITGGNGTGKSNVYRALRLLVDAADGQLGKAIAREGGMPSVMWAGPEGKARGTKKAEGVRLGIGFADDTVAYELRLGLPQMSAFPLDPEVKEETLRLVAPPKAHLLERRGVSVMVRDGDGRPVTFGAQLAISESVMAQLAEPHRFPMLSMLRERVRRWRFYHHFRTDPESPLRAVQTGTYTPVLAHDGADVASAIHTIRAIGDGRALDDAIAEAFDGATLTVADDDPPVRFLLRLTMPNILRPLAAPELSDGTLRYIALLAALYTPRPPELLVLNEPETSLHPRVLAPLAKQIIAAATRSQVIVVSHAEALVDAMPDATRIELAKTAGATVVAGRAPLDEPAWKWTP